MRETYLTKTRTLWLNSFLDKIESLSTNFLTPAVLSSEWHEMSYCKVQTLQRSPGAPVKRYASATKLLSIWSHWSLTSGVPVNVGYVAGGSFADAHPLTAHHIVYIYKAVVRRHS